MFFYKIGKALYILALLSIVFSCSLIALGFVIDLDNSPNMVVVKALGGIIVIIALGVLVTKEVLKELIHGDNKRPPLNKVLIVAGSFVAMLLLWVIFSNTVNLSERLPAKIHEENIMYGKIQAFLPDILYMKYGLRFVTGNPILEEGVRYDREFYYYVYNIDRATASEQSFLRNNPYTAENFLKYSGEDGKMYLLTISNRVSGSINFHEMTIRLYEIDNDNIAKIFDRTETYSVDPGYDSSFIAERLKLFLYKHFIVDDRYKVATWDVQ